MKRRELESLIDERNNELDVLAIRVKELEAKLEEYYSREKSIISALTSATETKEKLIAKADSLLASAHLEAEGVLAKANKEAARIVEAATNEAKARTAEESAKTERLERVRRELQADLVDFAHRLHDALKEFANIPLPSTPVAARAQRYEAPTSYTVEPSMPPIEEDFTLSEETEAIDSHLDNQGSKSDYDSPAQLFHEIMAIRESNPSAESFESFDTDSETAFSDEDLRARISDALRLAADNADIEQSEPCAADDSDEDDALPTTDEVAASLCNEDYPTVDLRPGDDLFELFRDVVEGKKE